MRIARVQGEMEMIRNLIKDWWAFVLQGVLAIAVGVAAFVVPGPTLAAFLAVFGAYAIVTGVFETVGGFTMPGGTKWSLVAVGLVGIAVGVLALVSPASTAVAVTLLVGVYSIATGVARTAVANILGNVRGNWLLGLSGIASVFFGVLLIAAPGAGVLAVLWLIGFYAIFAGIMAIAFGLQLRGVDKDVSRIEKTLASDAGSPVASH
jgi:uncharacterized membrane protein HdeD (DUF308 family)